MFEAIVRLHTAALQESQEFAIHYGGYRNNFYLIAGGDVSKFE
jgi:hypothetical protein